MNELKKIIVFAVLVACLGSCGKEELTPVDENIVGVWHLVNMKASFGGRECDYDKGLIVWTFDENNLSIEDNSTDQNNDCIQFPSSTREYYLADAGEDLVLYLGNSLSGSITFNAGEMVIDQNTFVSDSYTMKFVR